MRPLATMEQGAFLREQQENLVGRLLKVARADLEISVSALAQRFGKPNEFILRKLKDHGLERVKAEVTFKDTMKAGGVAGGSFNRWRRR